MNSVKPLRLLSLVIAGMILTTGAGFSQPAGLALSLDKNSSTLAVDTGSAKLPVKVMQRLRRTASRQVRVPVARLKVTDVQTATWDGCFGIYKPNQFCTKIAISGWRAVVTDGDRSWVYHLNQDGTQMGQNPTASDSRGGVVTSFIPEEELPQTEESIVFQSIVSGDLTGRTTYLTLQKDGTLTRWVMAPYIRSLPVVVKKLSQQQVEQFQNVLETQRLPNLHRMSYLSKATIADYPRTMLQGMGRTVQYIDLESKNLPKSLQEVVQAWEQISATKS